MTLHSIAFVVTLFKKAKKLVLISGKLLKSVVIIKRVESKMPCNTSGMNAWRYLASFSKETEKTSNTSGSLISGIEFM